MAGVFELQRTKDVGHVSLADLSSETLRGTSSMYLLLFFHINVLILVMLLKGRSQLDVMLKNILVAVQAKMLRDLMVAQ